MVDKFQWVKLGLENIKVIVPMLLFLLSTIGFTFNSNLDKDAEIKASQKQIAEIAGYYAAPKTVTVKSNCDKCMKEVKRLWEFH